MLPETIKTRGLHAAIRFAPAAVLDKEHKQQFQIKCNEGFDWQRQDFGTNAWRLISPQSEGDPRSVMKLSLHPDVVKFEDIFPTGPLDLFFDNMKLALGSVASVFGPRVITGSGIVVRLTAQSEDGDARVFLGQKCLGLEDQLSALGRPVHAVGLKMLLPPLPGEGKPNWQAEVKIESLVEDIRQIYIEVDARWATPMQWDPDKVVDRVRIGHEFAMTQVVAFLKQFGNGPSSA